MNKSLLIAPLLALAIAAAGCGNSDSNEFIEGYNDATAPLQKLTTDLGSAVGGGAGANAKLTQLADGLDDVQTKLADLDPPEGAQDELDAMLKALDNTADQVREIAKSAKSGDVEALTAAATKLQTTGNELVTAENNLKTAVED
jgi:ABC-type transporter Mla subunit MlaD